LDIASLKKKVVSLTFEEFENLIFNEEIKKEDFDL
jgi:hypothetical protein